MFKFPISESSPVEHGVPLPAQADVVIIGGGVVGVSAALFLARKGLRAVVVEKGRIAGEQSSRNWGWIRQQGRDPDELPIMVEAGQHWRALAAQTNESFGLVQGGVTYMARDAKEMAGFESWLPYARANGVDTRLMTSDELADHLPGATRRWPGALYTASDMRAEPWLAVPALARMAVREGAVILENCAARGLDLAAGRVAGLATEQGVIKTTEVIVAGGAWSALFLRNTGVSIPQLSVKASVVAVDAAPMAYQGGATDDKLAFRPRADGGYSLAAGGFHELFIGPDAFRNFGKFWTQLKADPFGTKFLPAAPKGYPDAWGTPRRWANDAASPFEALRVLNPAPHAGKVAGLVRDFAALFPHLGEVRAKGAWAGMIDTMPDLVPVIDRAPIDGLTIATGMSGHGFGIGPGVGRVLSDLVTGGVVGHDLHRFRLGRFTDGTKMDLGPTV